MLTPPIPKQLKYRLYCYVGLLTKLCHLVFLALQISRWVTFCYFSTFCQEPLAVAAKLVKVDWLSPVNWSTSCSNEEKKAGNHK